MTTIEDFLVHVELSPSIAESPLKQIDDYINSVKKFLSENFFSKTNIFTINVSVNPDTIFSYSYLKSIISQQLNLFFSYSPPLISYTEFTKGIGNYFGIELQCFDENRNLKL